MVDSMVAPETNVLPSVLAVLKLMTFHVYLARECSFNQPFNHYFIVRLKVDQRAGQLSLPHLGITKTEKNRTKT